jgi:hypothetical protein
MPFPPDRADKSVYLLRLVVDGPELHARRIVCRELAATLIVFILYTA